MAKERNIGKAIIGASFLLMLAMILLFLYSNSQAVYSQDSADWKDRYLVMLIFFSVMLGVGTITSRKVLSEQAKAPYWKALVFRFIPSALVSVTILFVLKTIIKGVSSVNPLDQINYVPFSVIIFHLFVVSQVEEIMFRGILFESIASKASIAVSYAITAFVFAGFHYYSSGGSFLVMLTYIPLSYAFTYLKLEGWPVLKNIRGIGQFFGPSRYTQQSNAGAHFAWNAFILGFGFK
jgi:membrane protease YdiL (CAAX protease family)